MTRVQLSACVREKGGVLSANCNIIQALLGKPYEEFC